MRVFCLTCCWPASCRKIFRNTTREEESSDAEDAGLGNDLELGEFDLSEQVVTPGEVACLVV